MSSHHLTKSIIRIANSALNWTFPHKCVVCNSNLNSNYPVCNTCYPNLPFEASACLRCGQAFAADLDYCGRCINTPPSYDRCFCAFQYSHPLDQQIRRLKYSERPELAMQIAKLFKREVDNHQLALPDLLIPVPIHSSKLRERGFNQSLELTKCLSRLLKIPYNNNLVIKHKATRPQAQQTLSFRQKNLKGSFRYQQKTDAKHIAIIDDVITSGSTVEEITKILKRNGVDYIQAWGVTHTI